VVDLRRTEEAFLPERTDQILVVFGLERLDPMDNLTFRLRALLDERYFLGQRYLILCDQAAFPAHFHDYSAPFYQFCMVRKLPN